MVEHVKSTSSYDVLSISYSKVSGDLFLRCTEGHVYKTSLHNFNKGRRCPYCAWNHKKTPEEIKHILDKVEQGAYVLASEYLGYNKKLYIKHLECGHIWSTTLQNFERNNVGCFKCNNMTKGEKAVKDLLELKGLSYIFQFSFTDSRKKYDFAVIDAEGLPVLLIEYDGVQHFKPVEYFGGSKTFERNRLSDQEKEAMAATHKVPLLRVPYWKLDDVGSVLLPTLNEVTGG